jgi:hypothetical protein
MRKLLVIVSIVLGLAIPASPALAASKPKPHGSSTHSTTTPHVTKRTKVAKKTNAVKKTYPTKRVKHHKRGKAAKK